MGHSLKSRKVRFKFFAKILICAVTSIFLTCLAYFWYTYIDETVITGQAYGFSIGDDKLTTYKNAAEVLPNLNGDSPSIYIEIKVDVDQAELFATNPDYLVMVKTLLHDVGYPAFQLKDRWDFYFEGSYFNSLTLKFCDEKLCEIYRHRKYFELP